MSRKRKKTGRTTNRREQVPVRKPQRRANVLATLWKEQRPALASVAAVVTALLSMLLPITIAIMVQIPVLILLCIGCYILCRRQAAEVSPTIQKEEGDTP